ncbi:Histidine phosphatase superfamily (branch 2) [Popillia japonica]|uniref:Multiple inositol polyphosphate phosphatase 1 n=1 Tax=Popillia japonica TaxID=7064 RepID=A0AAW1KNM9_POPJA
MNFAHNIYYFMIFKILYWRKIRELQNHFGSKAPYSVVKNSNVEEIKKFGKPYKIWMVIRHGTRFPSLGQVRKMNSNLPVIHKKLVEHSKGSISIIERSLLTWALNELKNDFRSFYLQSMIIDYTILTNTDRTLESAQEFADGLFGENMMKGSCIKYTIDERLLRFYKLCAKWRNDIRYNPSCLREKELFQNTSTAKSTVKLFNERLGLINLLSFDEIEIIYKACIIEACNNRVSLWCTPFDKDIIKVLEYSEDLKHYWLDGYGFEITYKHACPLIKSMMEFFNSNQEYPKIVLNFTHSGVLLKVLSHLQLYKDETPLRHDCLNKNRKWQTSRIGGFGSNITFVLYTIGGKYKLLTLHQERIIRLPCCPDSDLCDFDVVRKYYISSLRDCNFDEMCCPDSDLCDFDVVRKYYISSLRDCNFDEMCENF